MNDRVKRDNIMRYCIQKKADVVLLQETHLNGKTKKDGVKRGNYVIYDSYFHRGSRGVCTMVRHTLPFKLLDLYTEDSGRILVLFGILLGNVIAIANVYGPNYDAPEFVDRLFQVMGRWGSIPLIIGGDFNYVLHSQLDRSSKIMKPLGQNANKTLYYMDIYNVVDAWRVRFPTVPGYSFFSAVHKVSSRIDRFLISNSIFCLMSDIRVEPKTLSDHSPIVMTIAWSRKYHRLKNWSFKPDIMREPMMADRVHTAVDLFFTENLTVDTTHQTRWEAFKCTIRGIIANDECAVRKVILKEKEGIEQKLRDLENQYNETQDNSLLTGLSKLQEAFRQAVNREHKFNARPQTARFYWQADKSNTLLSKILNSDGSSRVITELTSGQGDRIIDPDGILTELTSHLQEIYKGGTNIDITGMNGYLENMKLERLDQMSSEALEGPIQIGEIESAIKQLQSGKAPGHDGLGSDFYKLLRLKLAPILFEVYSEAFETGTLEGRLNEAKIALIPKPGGNKKVSSDYRPLSLINVDIKILAKILANRLLPQVTKIVHEDQNGFIPGRDTSSAIRRVFTVMAGTPPDAKAAIVAFDAYKAFDMIKWEYLFKTMEEMGIGIQFMRWVRILYNAPKARLNVNDSSSELIQIKSGTRQGCPLSAMLFAIGIEPLLRILNLKMGKAGIQVGKINNLTIAYADDLLVMLQDPAVDMESLLELMEEHGKFSGFRINWNKSVYFPFGGKAPLSSPDNRLTTRTEWFKYLGIKVAKSDSALFTLNYEEVSIAVNEKLLKWGKLPLNLAARVAVIKMSIMPKLLYVFHNVPLYIAKKYFNGLRSKITRFIWNNKIPRIANDKLTDSYENGGFELPDVHEYYKAAQLQHVLKWFGDGMHEPQVMMEMEWFGGIGASRVLLDNRVKYKCKEGPAKVGVKIWREVNRKIGDGSCYSEYMSLWDVSADKPKLKEGMFKKWVEHGVLLLQDLFIDGKLKDEKDLVDEAGGGLDVIMRWQTLQNSISKRWNMGNDEPPDNALITHALTSVGTRHQISKVYRLLRGARRRGDNVLKEKWETVLAETLSDRAWYEICIATRTVSFHMRLRLIHYRFLHMSYYTPIKLNIIYKRTDICCVKCGDCEADFVHMTWRCEKLQVFWNAISAVISEICQVEIDNTIKAMLLGVLPQMSILRLRWAKLAVTVAKLLIARKWLKPIAPTVVEWTTYLSFCAEQEDELHNIMPRTQAPKDIWSDFRNYLFLIKTAEVDDCID